LVAAYLSNLSALCMVLPNAMNRIGRNFATNIFCLEG
jgi:hypothetical protein